MKALNTKYIFFFLIIWLHMTLLDLFFVTSSGPVFLFEENSQPLTLLVHFSVAIATFIGFWLAIKVSQRYKEGKMEVREPILITSSILMVGCIGLLLLS